MEFKASLDTQAKVITGFSILLVAVIGWRCGQDVINRASDLKSAFALTGIFLMVAIVLFLAFLLAPQKYVLTREELVIKRLMKDVVIKLSNVAEVCVVPDSEMFWSIRTFGSGGFFGYFGRYYNAKIGSYTAYATRRNNRLLITTKTGEKIIITPDDVNMFSHIEERSPLS